MKKRQAGRSRARAYFRAKRTARTVANPIQTFAATSCVYLNALNGSGTVCVAGVDVRSSLAGALGGGAQDHHSKKNQAGGTTAQINARNRPDRKRQPSLGPSCSTQRPTTTIVTKAPQIAAFAALRWWERIVGFQLSNHSSKGICTPAGRNVLSLHGTTYQKRVFDWTAPLTIAVIGNSQSRLSSDSTIPTAKPSWPGLKACWQFARPTYQ